jgi:hypothetical protein
MSPRHDIIYLEQGGVLPFFGPLIIGLLLTFLISLIFSGDFWAVRWRGVFCSG